MREEGRRALAWWPAVAGGDAHAGRTETSLMLALDRSHVRLDLAAEGTTTPLPELWPELQAGGVAAVSPTGVLGDPRGASIAEGERVLSLLVADCHAAVDAWIAAERGTGDGGS
jgi:creatinine amidohydrolase